MAEEINPDYIILKKKPITKEEQALFDAERSVPMPTKEAFAPKKDWIEKLCDWWDNLKIRPHVAIRRGPDAPDGHSVEIGISGTF